jgi:selenocysteine lyase/cysteine desulfurase
MLYSCHHREKDEVIVQKLEHFANEVSIHFFLQSFIVLVFFLTDSLNVHF